LLARLASLIPPPRHPLVRYFGVLSSASKWRQHVVPQVPAHRVRACDRAHTAERSKIRVTGGQQLCLDTAPQSKPEAESATERRSRGCVQAATRYLPWHELLKRVYDLDSLLCPRCGGRLKFVSVIMDQAVARKILGSLGLPCDPPIVARARAPTLFDEPPPPDYDAA
jgi:hypothetical protein